MVNCSGRTYDQVFKLIFFTIILSLSAKTIQAQFILSKSTEPDWHSYEMMFSKYYSKGDMDGYAKAFTLVFEHHDKAVLFKNCAEEVISLRRLAILYETINKAQNDLDTALIIIQSAEKKAYSCNLPIHLIRCLIVKGVIIHKFKKTEQSIAVFKKALKIADSLSLDNISLPIYPRIISAYLNINKPDSADYYMGIAQRKIFTCSDDDLAKTLELELIDAQIEIWIKKKDYRPALELVLCMLDQEEVQESYSKTAHFSNIAESCYESLGNYPKALKMAQKRSEAEYKISSQDYMKRIKDLEAQYQLKTSEMKMLEQEADLRVKQAMLLMLGIVLAILFISGSIITINFLKERKLNKEVLAKNKELKKEQEKNLLLFKELQHRVKNNLQILSSLNRMEMRQLKNQDALNFAQNLQNRILTMGVLYEDLFKLNNKSVNLHEYLNHIGNEVMNSMGKKDIQIENNLPDINILPNGAMYLGLIVNELITNSVKHNIKTSGNLLIQLLFDIKEDSAAFTYSDNGEGSQPETPTRKGFGISFIELLTSELEGEITWNFEKGCRVILNFSNLALFLADGHPK